jgi:hypothetical protein
MLEACGASEMDRQLQRKSCVHVAFKGLHQHSRAPVIHENFLAAATVNDEQLTVTNPINRFLLELPAQGDGNSEVDFDPKSCLAVAQVWRAASDRPMSSLRNSRN